MFYLGDDIRLLIHLNEDVSSATDKKVFYKKPHGTDVVIAEVTSVEGTDVVVFDLPKAENDQAGAWKFWVGITNADGKYATSTEMLLEVEKHG